MFDACHCPTLKHRAESAKPAKAGWRPYLEVNGDKHRIGLTKSAKAECGTSFMLFLLTSRLQRAMLTQPDALASGVDQPTILNLCFRP